MAEYQSYRSYGPFEAMGGRYKLTPTSATHIHIDANANSASDVDSPDGLRVVVRGIPYGASVHLYRREDGSWDDLDAEGRSSLYMSRLDRYTGPRDLHASASAQQAVRDKLYPVVVAWAEVAGGKAARAEADKVDANNAIWRAEQERAKHVKEVMRLDAIIREATDRL
jgi:hypothetical protein